MSNVNIRRAVENIRGQTSVYTPLIEIVVNAIQAIESSGRKDGRVIVKALRAPQFELDKERPANQGFQIIDNGIGFTHEHRESFDTLYSETKIKEGGKGFGRFTCLKYFDDVRISSFFAKINTIASE
jgi:nitrogen-specific signal transduction histidine kinase